MKKRFKHLILSLAAAMALCLALSPAALALPPATADFYVNDYADVLSEATKKDIMATAPALAQSTGAQVVVLTTNDLENMTPPDYALAIGRSWGIGAEKDDNGVLILLSPAEGQIRVEVGYGLEGALNDAKVGRYIDHYAMDYYRGGDFDRGTLELYRAVLSEVMLEYGLEALPGYEPLEDYSNMFTVLTLALVIIVVVVGIVSFIFGKNNRRGGGSNNRGGGPPIFWGGGGYRGGGGFGGGGFRGGGGGFGGGGAGRSFCVPE
jgi:uncharacterized protein